jgi:succinate dehydrogenase / fumarate reductase cytochrome b subunit
MTVASAAIPKAFIWRRIHSLMGLWIVLFLIEHLLTNSQAALWMGDNGQGFINMVNMLHNLPYLEVIELILIGVPILIHACWGVKYLLTSKFNTHRTDGSTPYLPLGRNRAYTWQRITSWILLIGIVGHVAKFRFLEYPKKVHVDDETVYLVNITPDRGLYTLANRLGVTLYGSAAIDKEETTTPSKSIQSEQARAKLVTALEKEKLSPEHVMACAKEFGTASLLVVRNTFKSPIYIGLYTIFVIAACFHACNGFWTFLITWGWVLKMAAQRAWVMVSIVFMALLLFLGLAAIWGT